MMHREPTNERYTILRLRLSRSFIARLGNLAIPLSKINERATQQPLDDPRRW